MINANICTATTASHLKLHIRCKHEGVRYPCDKCEFVTTKARNRMLHIRRKHEGVRYPCDKCKYMYCNYS